MHSYEERIRAIEVCIELGKRVRETVRQLGYPTTNFLRSWRRRARGTALAGKGLPAKEPNYSQAKKDEAVRHHLDNGRCISHTMNVK